MEWEFKGTPGPTRQCITRWSPHMYVRNFKTPTLVTAGELDYRVPYTESLQLFTALQRMVWNRNCWSFPTRVTGFKNANSELWYRTVLEWFDKHLSRPRIYAAYFCVDIGSPFIRRRPKGQPLMHQIGASFSHALAIEESCSVL